MLVIAVQNVVEYRDLGVATFGAMLFRLGYAWPMKGTSIRMPIEAFVEGKEVEAADH